MRGPNQVSAARPPCSVVQLVSDAPGSYPAAMSPSYTRIASWRSFAKLRPVLSASSRIRVASGPRIATVSMSSCTRGRKRRAVCACVGLSVAGWGWASACCCSRRCRRVWAPRWAASRRRSACSTSLCSVRSATASRRVRLGICFSPFPSLVSLHEVRHQSSAPRQAGAARGRCEQRQG